MPFLCPIPAKFAVAIVAGFVLSGCMTTSRIPAPVEHRDSQQAKGIVVDSGQAALDSKQPGQADYRLAQTPQAGARGQWPQSRIAATDPNNAGGLRQSAPPLVQAEEPQNQINTQARVVGVPQANGSVVIAPAQNQPANATVVQRSNVPTDNAAARIKREPVRQAESATPPPPQPKPLAAAKTPKQAKAAAPKTVKAAPAKPSQPKQPIAGAKQPKQPVQKETTKVAIAPKPTQAKPTANKPAPKTIAAIDSKFIWPAHGALVHKFADKKSMGIGISGRAGDRVNATADGEVIFSGLGPRGYGKLLIVKHNPELLSVYAHNRNLLVKEGQEVRQGQKIAELGSTGTDRPKLHFEIRRQGKPVDPLAFLPQRK